MGIKKLVRVIILKSIKFSEADLIIHGLSSSGYFYSFIAKSALKSKKRFGGGILEPTHYVEMTYLEKPNKDLHILEEAVLLEGFDALRTNYEKLKMALYFLSLLEKVSRYSDGNDVRNFNLLGNALKCLDSVEVGSKKENGLENKFESQFKSQLDNNFKDNIEKLRVLFELKFLDYQGVLPPELLIPKLLNLNLSDYQKLSLPIEEKSQINFQIKNGLEDLLGHFSE